MDRKLKRRTVLAATPAVLGLSACEPSAVQGFSSIEEAMAAVRGLSSGHRGTGAWTLAQMLDHAAQSVEYSLRGFPQPKPAWFRASVGSAAFALFSLRGRMSHGLSEPIPGAPALNNDLPAAIERLLRALGDFQAYDGALQPHFAYGALDKAQYTRAHLMHLANHWDEVVKADVAPATARPADAGS